MHPVSRYPTQKKSMNTTTLCRVDWVETRSDREARLARAQCGTLVPEAPDPATLPAPDPPVAALPGPRRGLERRGQGPVRTAGRTSSETGLPAIAPLVAVMQHSRASAPARPAKPATTA